MNKMQVLLAWLVVCVSQAAVLDPALYLSPSPPLTGEPRALDQWSRQAEPSSEPTLVQEPEHLESPTDEQEEPQARTFWSSPSYGIRGIHIPLTFSLTGTYGTNTGIPTGIIGGSYRTGLPGVIGSSYASVAEDVPFGKSGLAGSSYGLYRSGLPGTRIYGGSGGAAWSGWGNGKWGHYGKG